MEVSKPDFGHAVLPLSTSGIEAVALDLAEDYYSRRLKDEDHRGLYSSVRVEVPGQTFLDRGVLQQHAPQVYSALSLVTVDGIFTDAGGDPAKALTERVYYLILSDGNGTRSLGSMTYEQVNEHWADPANAELGDRFTAAAVRLWMHYRQGVADSWASLDYYVAMYDAYTPIDTLKGLIKNRTYHSGQPYVYGYCRLTDLGSGETYSRIPAALFGFTADSRLVLDWENARADGSGLFEDARLMLQLENVDGSWYIQLHDGKDGYWIYVSECGMYVPLNLVESRTEAAKQVTKTLTVNYEHYLWCGYHIDNYGSLSAEEAVRLYLEGVVEAKERVGRENLTGNVRIGSVDVEDVDWSMNEGRISLSYTVVYGEPESGDFYINYWVDPYVARHKMEVTLVRGEDGLWRTE